MKLSALLTGATLLAAVFAALPAVAQPASASAQKPPARPTAAASHTIANPNLLSPTWLGRWRLVKSNLLRFPDLLEISMRGNAAHIGLEGAAFGQTCELAYDGLVTQQSIVAKLLELKDWQLRKENWPEGTNPDELIGLKKEFDEALALARSVDPDTYKRVRPKGDDCAGRDDTFWLLHNGQRLVRFSFPASSLGAAAAVFERVK